MKNMDFLLQENTSSNMNANTYNAKHEFNNNNYHQNSYHYYQSNNNNSIDANYYNNFYDTNSTTTVDNNTQYNNTTITTTATTATTTNTTSTNNNILNYATTATSNSNNNSNPFSSNDYYSYVPSISKAASNNEYEHAYNSEYKFKSDSIQNSSSVNNYYDWSSAVNHLETPVVTPIAQKSSPMNQSDTKYYSNGGIINMSGQGCYGSYNLNQHYDEYHHYDMPATTVATNNMSCTIRKALFSNEIVNNNSGEMLNWDYASTNNSNNAQTIYPSIVEANNKSQALNENTKFNELATYSYNCSVENTEKIKPNYNFDSSISTLNDNINKSNNTSSSSNSLSHQFGYNTLQLSNDRYIDKNTIQTSNSEDMIGFSATKNLNCQVCGKNSTNFTINTGTCEACNDYYERKSNSLINKEAIKKEINPLNYPIQQQPDAASFLGNYQMPKMQKRELKKAKAKSNNQKMKTKKSSKMKKHSSMGFVNYNTSNYFNIKQQTTVEMNNNVNDCATDTDTNLSYEIYMQNELSNAEIIKTKQQIILSNIKNLINDRRSSIKSLFTSYNGAVDASKEDINLKYENFKTILQNYLFNLMKLLVKCIIDTIEDKYSYSDVNNEEFSYEIVNFLNTTNNKSLLFAYIYLIENIDETLEIIPENDYEKPYKNFKKSLKKIYLNIDDDSSKIIENSTFNSNCGYNNKPHQFVGSSEFTPYSNTQTTFVGDKDYYFLNGMRSKYSEEQDNNNKILCSSNELKMLNFIFLLFSKFINTDFDFSLFNCSLKDICSSNSFKTDKTTSRSNETCKSTILVRIACIKIITKLIDQLCIDKTIKTKILLNASDLV